METTKSGGCLCGKVRYSIDWPPTATMSCHCKNCQKQSGSALSTIAMLPREAVRIKGTLKTYLDHGDSGAPVLRKFCDSCGSPVITDVPAMPAMLFIKTGTLDDTSGAAPATHMWTCSAQDWFVFPEGVPTMDRQ